VIVDRHNWHTKFGDLLSETKPAVAEYPRLDADKLKERQAFYRLAYNKEPHDCAVRALTVACAAPYERAHLALQECGRKDGHASSVHQLRTAALYLGCYMALVESPGKTLLTAERALRNTYGGFILITCNHAVGIWDGELIDHARGKLFRVEQTYRLQQKEKQK